MSKEITNVSSIAQSKVDLTFEKKAPNVSNFLEFDFCLAYFQMLSTFYFEKFIQNYDTKTNSIIYF